MATVPVQQLSVSSTLSAAECKTREPITPPDMHRYLTEELHGVKHQHYRGIRSFTRAIELQADQLRANNSEVGQYVVFSFVNQTKLATIDRIRNTRHKGLRFLYLDDEAALIVKISPGVVEQKACNWFECMLIDKAETLGGRGVLVPVGTTCFKGNGSQKEADGGFRPSVRENRWPSVVIEGGIPERRGRLEVDSCWWLSNSGGQVKVVVTVEVSKIDRKIRLAQWEMVTKETPEDTQTHSQPTKTRLTRTSQVDIVAGVAIGAPFTISFQNVFLRQPTIYEGDIEFTSQDLERYATDVWNSAQ